MSNRIVAAKVKAALGAHAPRQLQVMGVQSQRGTVQFSGTTAFAFWSGDEDRVYSWGINYPELADNASISRKEADLMSAYTLHEIGHILFTENNATRGRSQIVHQLWNGIEDGRIEHAVIRSGQARGARSMFRKLLSSMTIKTGPTWNPCSIVHAPFALALISRAAFKDGNGFAKQLLSRIPEPKRSLYQAVVDGLQGVPMDRSGSAKCLELAVAFLAGWNALRAPQQGQEDQEDQEEPGSAPKGSGEPQDGTQEEGEDSGPNGTGEFQDDEEKDEPSETGDGDGKMGSPDFGDEFEDDYDNESGVDSETEEERAAREAKDEAFDAIEAAEKEQEEKDAAAARKQAEANAKLFDATDEGDGDEASDGFSDGGSAGKDQYNDVEEGKEEDALSPEPSLDALFGAINARTLGAVSLDHAEMATRVLMKNITWKKIASEENSAKTEKKLDKNNRVPALKSQMMQILKAPERCGWDGGALGGRFDSRRAVRAIAGQEAVFKTRWFSEGINTAVSVVLDMSGSMSGTCMSTAVDLAWIVARACEASGADVEIVGFNDKYAYKELSSGRDLLGHYREERSGNGSARLLVAKQFHESCRSAARFMSIMKKLADCGTPDYSAVKTVTEYMAAMPHQRKLVIVITDGFGYVNQMLKLSQSSPMLYGVDIIGFGIYCHPGSFSKAYNVGTTIQDIESLHKTSMKAIAKQLRSRDTRRLQ